MQGAAPIDQPVLSVDKAITMQPDKGLLDCRNQVVIHGEGTPAPVYADAHAPHLPKDLAAVGLHPSNYLLQESLSTCQGSGNDCVGVDV